MAESPADSLMNTLDRYLTELADSISPSGAYPTHLDLSYDALERWVTNVCLTLEGHNLKGDADRLRDAGMTASTSAESAQKNDRRGLLRKLVEAKAAELQAIRDDLEEHQSWSNALKERFSDNDSEAHPTEETLCSSGKRA